MKFKFVKKTQKGKGQTDEASGGQNGMENYIHKIARKLQ